MSVSLRILDDGAWVSVNDERRVAVSQLWPVAGVCRCALADFLVEGFTDVSVDGLTVTVEAHGTCVRCGQSGTADTLPVGRIVDGEFRELATGTVRPPPTAPTFRQVSP